MEKGLNKLGGGGGGGDDFTIFINHLMFSARQTRLLPVY